MRVVGLLGIPFIRRRCDQHDLARLGLDRDGCVSDSAWRFAIDTTIFKGATISVAATATDDGNPAGSVLSNEWLVKTGVAANVNIASANQLVSDVTFSQIGVYTLQVVVSDGELVASEIIAVNVTPHVAVEDIKEPDLRMYPNPVSHMLTFELLNIITIHANFMHCLIEKWL